MAKPLVNKGLAEVYSVRYGMEGCFAAMRSLGKTVAQSDN